MEKKKLFLISVTFFLLSFLVDLELSVILFFVPAILSNYLVFFYGRFLGHGYSMDLGSGILPHRTIDSLLISLAIANVFGMGLVYGTLVALGMMASSLIKRLLLIERGHFSYLDQLDFVFFLVPLAMLRSVHPKIIFISLIIIFLGHIISNKLLGWYSCKTGIN
jgi:hypothetical protein